MSFRRLAARQRHQLSFFLSIELAIIVPLRSLPIKRGFHPLCNKQLPSSVHCPHAGLKRLRYWFVPPSLTFPGVRLPQDPRRNQGRRSSLTSTHHPFQFCTLLRRQLHHVLDGHNPSSRSLYAAQEDQII